MSISTDQFRTALADLNGQRDVRIHFDHGPACLVHGALLVPAEADRLVKLTDGTREFVIDAHRIAWIEIGPSGALTVRA